LSLTLLDWAAIAGYLLITLVLGLYFPAQVGAEHRGLFCLWAAGELVAGGNVHGGNDVCRGHAAGGYGAGLRAGCGRDWLWWSFLPSGMMTVFCLRDCGGAPG